MTRLFCTSLACSGVSSGCFPILGLGLVGGGGALACLAPSAATTPRMEGWKESPTSLSLCSSSSDVEVECEACLEISLLRSIQNEDDPFFSLCLASLLTAPW